MKVKAINPGYYDGQRRRPGGKNAEFVLSDPKHFSERWMQDLSKPKAPEAEGRAEVAEEKPARKRGRSSGDAEVI